MARANWKEEGKKLELKRAKERAKERQRRRVGNKLFPCNKVVAASQPSAQIKPARASLCGVAAAAAASLCVGVESACLAPSPLGLQINSGLAAACQFHLREPLVCVCANGRACALAQRSPTGPARPPRCGPALGQASFGSTHLRGQLVGMDLFTNCAWLHKCPLSTNQGTYNTFDREQFERQRGRDRLRVQRQTIAEAAAAAQALLASQQASSGGGGGGRGAQCDACAGAARRVEARARDKTSTTSDTAKEEQLTGVAARAPKTSGFWSGASSGNSTSSMAKSTGNNPTPWKQSH